VININNVYYTEADCHVLPHTFCYAGQNKLHKSLITTVK